MMSLGLREYISGLNSCPKYLLSFLSCQAESTSLKKHPEGQAVPSIMKSLKDAWGSPSFP